jgi:hypothetical protein
LFIKPFCLGQEAYFGSQRSGQSDYRKAAFDDLVDKCTEGIKVGNSYLQSFLKHSIEEYKFADLAYTLPGKRRVSTFKEHYIQYIRIQKYHFQVGDHLFSSVASIMT